MVSVGGGLGFGSGRKGGREGEGPPPLLLATVTPVPRRSVFVAGSHCEGGRRAPRAVSFSLSSPTSSSRRRPHLAVPPPPPRTSSRQIPQTQHCKPTPPPQGVEYCRRPSHSKFAIRHLSSLYSTPVRCHRSRLLPRARRPSSLSAQPSFRRRLFAVHVHVFVQLSSSFAFFAVHVRLAFTVRVHSLFTVRVRGSSGSHVAPVQTLRPTRALHPAVELLSFVAKECIVIMVQWQRHFLPVFRQIAHTATTSSPQGKGLTTLTARTILLPSISSRSPVYHSFQYQGISGSTCLLSKSSNLEQTPTSSPLALTSFLGSKEAQDQKQTPVKKERVQAVMSKIKQSPKKVNLVAALVRGMLVKDALLQLQVTVKRASRTVYQGITQAQGNAVNNHGLDAERLIVAEAFVGKGLFRKKVSYHSKGRAGIKVKPECRLTVVVREITAEEEAKIARLKVHNFRKLTKREKRLVPHQLIVSNPVWGRKNKSSDRNSSATAA
ncbi:hypothetical protein Ahy_Scaffold1g107329 isoform A [Arachis hypogaea]|uniref:Uncharacterized protein n=2 Tax=Arachis hypogaea TaxID=3818 RepID=A0A444WVD5_ARAHY|nr:hypothetical protein Ahy_Scaffold1g107329 isoform A [Arachis hypogaea]